MNTEELKLYVPERLKNRIVMMANERKLSINKMSNYILEVGIYKIFEEESECKSIGEYAFGNCTYITSIEIPSGVTSIGKAAFYECQKLKSIIIPKSVTSIGDSAFEDCTALDCVYYEGTAEDWAKISIDADNSDLTNAARYYYSEVKPAKDGNFWHYDYDGKAVLWNEK